MSPSRHGRPTRPQTGAIPATGGFVTASALRQNFRPDAIQARASLAGTRDERELLKAARSAAGHSDSTTEDSIQRSTPRESSVRGGLRFSC